LRYSTQTRTLAEMALVRLSNLAELDDLSDLISQLRSGAPLAPTASSTVASVPGSRSLAAPAPASATKKKTESNLAIEAAPAAEVSSEPATLTDENVTGIWQAALAQLGDLVSENAALAETVRAAGPGRLAATFRAKYTACKAFCERPDHLAKLEAALAEVAGGRVRVEFTTVADEPTAAAKSRAVPHRQRMAEKAEHPLVKKAGTVRRQARKN
jgi:hypothetical protein